MSQLAWAHAHETLIWASKGRGARHTFNYDLINSPNPEGQLSSVWRGRLEDVRAALEQVLEEVGVDEGESRVAIGEGPSDETGEPTQEQER